MDHGADAFTEERSAPRTASYRSFVLESDGKTRVIVPLDPPLVQGKNRIGRLLRLPRRSAYGSMRHFSAGNETCAYGSMRLCGVCDYAAAHRMRLFDYAVAHRMTGMQVYAAMRRCIMGMRLCGGASSSSPHPHDAQPCPHRCLHSGHCVGKSLPKHLLIRLPHPLRRRWLHRNLASIF